jgi:hypothetical protein
MQVHATPLQTLAAFSIAFALIGSPSAPFPLSWDSLTSSCRVNQSLKILIMGKEVSCKGQPPTPAQDTSCQEDQKYDAIYLAGFNSSVYLLPVASYKMTCGSLYSGLACMISDSEPRFGFLGGFLLLLYIATILPSKKDLHDFTLGTRRYICG